MEFLAKTELTDKKKLHSLYMFDRTTTTKNMVETVKFNQFRSITSKKIAIRPYSFNDKGSIIQKWAYHSTVTGNLVSLQK
jgi:hypothetical protein